MLYRYVVVRAELGMKPTLSNLHSLSPLSIRSQIHEVAEMSLELGKVAALRLKDRVRNLERRSRATPSQLRWFLGASK